MGYRLLTQLGSGRGSLGWDWIPGSLFSIPEAELLVTCPAHVPWLENWNAVLVTVAGAPGMPFYTPSQCLSSFKLYSWECTVHGGGCGEERPAVSHTVPVLCPVSLQVHLSLLSQIVFARDRSFNLLLYAVSPLQSKEQMGTLHW